MSSVAGEAPGGARFALNGAFRSPDDFVVEEIPLYPPSGEGTHTFVWIEKRLANSEDVARDLARAVGVKPSEIGYAGRKDRFAVTRQHFSVPGLDPERALELTLPRARVLRASRHAHKLRTGQLAGNRFVLRVAGLDAGVRAAAVDAAEVIGRIGLTNRFGPQRFGREGANVERARRLLQSGRPPRDRRNARFLISALQAWVFNIVLAERKLTLDRVELGDLARKTDSGGLFRVEDEALDNARAARFEISATGPIFGTRMDEPGSPVAEREREVMRRCGVEPDALVSLPKIRMRGARRPVRVPVKGLEIGEDADHAGAAEPLLILCFELPSGSYATVLLEELLGGEPMRGEPDPRQ